jgi:two-component system sensor histidine kinase KdpD
VSGNAYDPPVNTRARAMLVAAIWVTGSLVVGTAAVAFLQDEVGVANASPVYLVAVVLCGFVEGTAAAILAAIGASLIYNYFFTQPLYTLLISDPGVLLSVVVLLFVGIVVGQLAGLQRSRARAAIVGEREARALFGVSRVLATRSDTDVALAQIATALHDETAMLRVWIGLGPEPAGERVVADTDRDGQRPAATRIRVLQRTPGDDPARWALVHRPGPPGRAAESLDTYRVRIDASGQALGSIWALRSRELGEPDRTQTRLLGGVADQIGQALAHDRAEQEARAAEVARQSDALKSSLLQSVSHDFRTPLAVIRAAAGSLDADSSLSGAERHANAQAIEREVEYLNRLVANLLNLSRIEAGVLRAERDIDDLDELVGQAVERAQARLDGRTLEVRVDPVPVRVDAVFLDAALANVLDNATKYTPPGAHIQVMARPRSDGFVRLTVADDGPGVPAAALGHLFDKFYRGPGAPTGSRSGLGIGLAVVRGLIEASGGRVGARLAEGGGLAIDLDLPVANVPVASAPPDA